METSTKPKPVKNKTLITVITIAAIAVVAIIVPVLVISSGGTDGQKTSNKYITIGQSQQTVFGLTSRFILNYTVNSKETIGVFLYMNDAPINYGSRKSFLVDTNTASETFFNISVNIGSTVFERTYYCYVTAKYKLSSIVSNETAFLSPVNITLKRFDPSLVTIPPTSNAPSKPTLTKLSWYTLSWEPTYGIVTYVVFSSQYGKISPNVGFVVYQKIPQSQRSWYTNLINGEWYKTSSFQTDTTTKPTGSPANSVVYEGKYVISRVGLTLTEAQAPPGNWVWKIVVTGTGTFDPLEFKIATTLFGVESDPVFYTIDYSSVLTVPYGVITP